MPTVRFPVRLIAPATLVLALLVGACGGPAATAAPTTGAALPSAGATASPAPSESPTPTETAAAPATLPPATVPPVTDPPITEAPITPPPTAAAPAVGVAVPVGDQQLMTVLVAEEWPGTTSLKPGSGKTFFTVSIRIDAILLTSFDSADFKLKDAAGHVFSWRTGRSPHLYDLKNMTPGNNYVGWITYEIPKASLVGMTLVYKPRFLGGTSFLVPVS